MYAHTHEEEDTCHMRRRRIHMCSDVCIGMYAHTHEEEDTCDMRRRRRIHVT
jgi:hypothetical protein